MRYALTALAAVSALVSGPALAADGDAAHLAKDLADPDLQAEVAVMAQTDRKSVV